MTGQQQRTDDFMAGLGANEQALLSRIPVRFLRKLATRAVRVKMRLQFTGWLQYVLPLVVVVPLAMIATIALWVDIRWVALLVGGVAGLVLTIALFDLVTVKFKVRPPERRPKRNDDLDVFDLMRLRRSCRSFQTGSLSENDRADLMESVRLHLDQPTISASPVRLEYIAAPLTVWPTVNATEFLVAIVPKEYNRQSVVDVGRSLQRVVLDATRMGLGACWIGPGADHASILRHLGERFDPDRDQIICVSAVGYKSRYVPLFIRIFNRQVSRRLPLSELVFSDASLVEPVDMTTASIARFGRTFEICQWAPSSYNGQTTRCVVSSDDNGEVRRVDFYAVTASSYYAPVALGIWSTNWEMGCNELGIEGKLEMLAELETQEALPRYDLSWIAT